MAKGKRVLWIVLGGLIFLGVAYVAASLFMVDFIIDWLWHGSLGYSLYFWMRLIYRYIVLLGVTLFFFVLFYANFWITARFYPRKPSETPPNKWLGFLRSGSRKVSLLVALVLAVVIAIPLFHQWETFLLFLAGPSTGLKDPILAKDISFYLLSLPVFQLVQRELLIVFAILFAWVLFMYLLTLRRKKSDDSLTISAGARIHLNALLLIVIGLAAWGIWLQRYALLYVNTHAPLFHGPGYIEMKVELPTIYALAVSLVLLGSSAAVLIQIGRGVRATLLLAVFLVIAILARQTDALKGVIDKYVVQPNQLIKERRYIAADIQTTLLAYNLAQVQTIKHTYSDTRQLNLNDPDLVASLQNIPVWDIELLGDVYQELQGIRTYYTFTSVDVNRYQIEGRARQVYSGAREIDISRLPAYAKSWINTHLQYTHGQGLVMTPAAQPADEPMTWLVKDIPPHSDYGIAIPKPEIYYGLESKPFVIVPNEVGEIGQPKGAEDASVVHYRGTGGVNIGSALRKLMFAIYLGDRNVFFTTKTVHDSRILFRRNIVERVQLLVPFLTLDSDPYLVTTPEGLFWIVDAYTASDRFPSAPSYDGVHNYIRNSVKATVDAYNGDVTFYVADPKDPIARAYQRIYPGLFKSMEAMPEAIKPHLRYPRDIFQIQMDIYAKYHQTDAERFYRQEDIWQEAKMTRDGNTVSMPSYYITIDLIQPGHDEFVLLMPMTPYGRDNLRAIVLAGCDGANYGKLFVYGFSREEQVYGPSQINALINQDTEISQAFTLWDQMASEVIRGKIIIDPVGGTILYIQPIYLQETSRLKIPQLKRLIVTQGDAVVMASSMEEAVAQLNDKLARLKERRSRDKGAVHEPAKPEPARPPQEGGGE
jgi:uncharacterized membrane protein (UPF0182 family)